MDTVLTLLLCSLAQAATGPRQAVEPRPHTFDIFADDGAPGDQFGLGVALHGRTLVAGAYAADTNGSDSGSAYVYELGAGGWRQTAKLLPHDPAPGDEFGLRVALFDDTAIVGSALDDDAGSESGSAYVFRKSGDTWREEAKLTSADAAPGDQFGRWVGLHRDTAVISSYLSDVSGKVDAGRAYVFRRVGGSWFQEARLQAPELQAGARFARSVSIGANTIAIGAVFEDHGASARAGSAYVFEYAAGAWSAVARLRAPDAEAGDNFGNAVFVRGGVLVVGSNRARVGPHTDAGKAYVYERVAGTWTLRRILNAPGPAANDRFGRSVCTDGRRIAVGAIWDDNRGGIDSGAATLFERGPAGWSFVREFVPAAAGPGDFLGYTVAVDGPRAIAGSYLHDPPRGQDAGAVFGF